MFMLIWEWLVLRLWISSELLAQRNSFPHGFLSDVSPWWDSERRVLLAKRAKLQGCAIVLLPLLLVRTASLGVKQGHKNVKSRSAHLSKRNAKFKTQLKQLRVFKPERSEWVSLSVSVAVTLWSVSVGIRGVNINILAMFSGASLFFWCLWMWRENVSLGLYFNGFKT